MYNYKNSLIKKINEVLFGVYKVSPTHNSIPGHVPSVKQRLFIRLSGYENPLYCLVLVDQQAVLLYWQT